MNKAISTYKHIIAGAFILFMFASCRKDYLERAPSDFISEGEVFSNIDNAEAFLNNAYRSLPDFQVWTEDGGGLYYIGDGTDEMGYQQSSFVTQTPFDFNTGNWNPVSFPMQHLWKDYFSAVRRINMFLANFDKIPGEVTGGGAASGRKARLQGEAYALRATYYFELFKRWGGVPILDKPLDPYNGEALPKRATPDEVVNFIKDDIARAIGILPASYDASLYGRMTATSCKALLSRLTLYYASPLWNTGADQGRWQDAATAAKDAMDYAAAAGYVLSQGTANGLKAYERVFLELNNPEVILARQDIDNQSFWWDYYMMPLSSGAYNVQGPLQEMVDAYEMTNGELPVLGYDASGNQQVNPSAGYDPLHPYVNRDPRFYQSIIYTGATWQGRTMDIRPGGADQGSIGGILRTFYWCRKGVLETHNLFAGSGNALRRYVLFRLAELYLNYAEAENEILSGPDATVYSAVNAIRQRAGMPDLPAGLSKDDMRKRIYHERQVELAFEGHRFWDVRRWKIAEQVDNKPVHYVAQDAAGKFSYPVFQTRTFDPGKHYLFPIPQSEIDKNPGLTQNTGW